MMAIITGGRDYTNQDRVKQVLDAAVTRMGLWCIIEGEAPGADALARSWALSRPDVSVIACPADWDGWEKAGSRNSAGPARNKFMLDILIGHDGDKAVIAFPGGNGTKNMIDLGRSKAARSANVKVIEA